jgi:hypothetical protein
MNKKIGHPYRVPENFFDDFKHEMTAKLAKRVMQKENSFRKIVFQSLKYAAIVAFSFFLGRESFRLNNKQNYLHNSKESYSVDAVYSQVSEDEFTEFIIENVTSEKLEQIKF